MPSRLPIFPLEVVLLPGAFLPLHIFEDRYKAMSRRCLEESRPFGIVLARERDLASIGCEARIDRVLRRYEDGRMDLLAQGERRFAPLGDGKPAVGRVSV